MKKFKINPLFILLIFLYLFLYNINLVITLIFSFTVHELSHVLVLKLNNIKIKSLTIYPFGGILVINKSLNTKNILDILIYIAGILGNLVLLLIGLIFEIKILYQINLLLFIFNLLPIYPMDGYYILLNTLSYFFPYYRSLYIVKYISISICAILAPFSLKLGLLYFLMIIYLFSDNMSLNRLKLTFYKFILDKTLYPNFNLKNRRISNYNLEVKKSLYKGYNNYLCIDNILVYEKDLLK